MVHNAILRDSGAVDIAWSDALPSTWVLKKSIADRVVERLSKAWSDGSAITLVTEWARMPKDSESFFNGTTPWALIDRQAVLVEHIGRQLQFLEDYAVSCKYGSTKGHRLSLLTEIADLARKYDPMDIAVAESISFWKQTDTQKWLVAFIEWLDGMVAKLLPSAENPDRSTFWEILWMGWEHMNLRYMRDPYIGLKASQTIVTTLGFKPLDTVLEEARYQ